MTTRERCANLQAEIQQKSAQLQGLGIQITALRAQPDLRPMADKHQQQITELSTELNQLRANLAADELLLNALDTHAEQLRAGDHGPLRAHIKHAHRPTTDTEIRAGRLAEIWAAMSIGLLLVSIVWLAYYAPEYLVNGILAIIYVTMTIEAGFRKRLASFVSGTSIVLALIALSVLIYEFVVGKYVAGCSDRRRLHPLGKFARAVDVDRHFAVVYTTLFTPPALHHDPDLLVFCKDVSIAFLQLSDRIGDPTYE